jgi:hypothetical protein
MKFDLEERVKYFGKEYVVGFIVHASFVSIYKNRRKVGQVNLDEIHKPEPYIWRTDHRRATKPWLRSTIYSVLNSDVVRALAVNARLVGDTKGFRMAT